MQSAEEYLEIINRAAAVISKHSPVKPAVGVVLGSGLSSLADRISGKTAIPYGDIDGFPEARVEGHAGEFVIGSLCGMPVALANGRFHYYEGYDQKTITLPIRVLQKLGVKTLILTNSAGGLVPALRPGDLMVVSDHINMMFDNPLIGPNIDELGPRFIATRGCYTEKLADIAFQVAEDKGLPLKEGVYVGTTGPVYETPATANFFRMIGGHAVGMSTVPEAIVAAHAGMELLAISLITDGAGKRKPTRLTHEEVLAVANRYAQNMAELVTGVIERLARDRGVEI